MENEIKPEQMVHGKWYVIDTGSKWLFKFDKIELNVINCSKYIHLNNIYYKSENRCEFALISNIKSIRPATNEEVLEYFPDEVLEEENYHLDKLVGKMWECVNDMHFGFTIGKVYKCQGTKEREFGTFILMIGDNNQGHFVEFKHFVTMFKIYKEEKTETNLIPFSWKKYQSGEFEVVCRDPKHKPILAGFNPDASDNYKIVAWINGIGYGFKEDGTRDADKDYELFLIKKKKKYQFFTAFYANGKYSTNYSSYDECERNTTEEGRIEIRKIEWEV